MNFHLEFPILPPKNKINYSDKFLSLGSCFSEEVGFRMKKNKINVDINPHGILYNPDSIAIALKRYIGDKKFREDDLFYANDSWNSWEHHSRFSDPDKKKCLTVINDRISSAHLHLKESNWLVITFGSAFSYLHNTLQSTVGNCHKIPQKEFTKSLLSVDHIIKEYKELIDDLAKLNPSLNIILTISPVRYIRDGIVENNQSKAILIQAVHELVKSQENLFYFPSYELVIDDLRDYRFYKTDLVHPNEQAVNYVFEKFIDSCFNDESKSIFEKVNEILMAAEHKPFNKNSDAHKKFKKSYLEKSLLLQSKYAFLDLNEEVKGFS
jgi:hypothetical protein